MTQHTQVTNPAHRLIGVLDTTTTGRRRLPQAAMLGLAMGAAALLGGHSWGVAAASALYSFAALVAAAAIGSHQIGRLGYLAPVWRIGLRWLCLSLPAAWLVYGLPGVLADSSDLASVVIGAMVFSAVQTWSATKDRDREWPPSHLAMGDAQTDDIWFREQIELRPSDPFLRNNFAMHLIHMGHGDDAVRAQQIAESLADHPQPAFIANLVNAHLAVGDDHAARESLNRCRALPRIPAPIRTELALYEIALDPDTRAVNEIAVLKSVEAGNTSPAMPMKHVLDRIESDPAPTSRLAEAVRQMTNPRPGLLARL